MTVYEASRKIYKRQNPTYGSCGKRIRKRFLPRLGCKRNILLGIKAVLAESYERIHRSNLVDLGVLPLQYKEGENAEKLGLTGKETFTFSGIAEGLKPLKEIHVVAKGEGGKEVKFQAIARLDSQIEIEYYRHGGILQYVLRQFLNKA